MCDDDDGGTNIRKTLNSLCFALVLEYDMVFRCMKSTHAILTKYTYGYIYFYAAENLGKGNGRIKGIRITSECLYRYTNSLNKEKGAEIAIFFLWFAAKKITRNPFSNMSQKLINIYATQ